MTERRHASRDYAHISTGALPSADVVRAELERAHVLYRTNREGDVSAVYPALAEAHPDYFGIAVAGANGAEHHVGDADVPFTLMSVSKAFVFALVCQELGPDRARDEIGVNATGLPFNSIEAVERDVGGRTNPMVNPGAMATTSRVPGATLEEKWIAIRDGLSAFAGRTLDVDEAMLASALATNERNREIARRLADLGAIDGDPIDAATLYTRQCCLQVTARELALMGATLATGGVQPRTHQRVVDAAVCHYTLAVMATAGLYERSGDWLYDIGLPGKSGISGCVVTIAPGKGALATFAPRLDAAGNSVKGFLVARDLSHSLGLDIFASRGDD